MAVELFRYQLEVYDLTWDAAPEPFLVEHHPAQVPSKVVVRIREHLMQHQAMTWPHILLGAPSMESSWGHAASVPLSALISMLLSLLEEEHQVEPCRAFKVTERRETAKVAKRCAGAAQSC